MHPRVRRCWHIRPQLSSHPPLNKAPYTRLAYLRSAVADVVPLRYILRRCAAAPRTNANWGVARVAVGAAVQAHEDAGDLSRNDAAGPRGGGRWVEGGGRKGVARGAWGTEQGGPGGHQQQAS